MWHPRQRGRPQKTQRRKLKKQPKLSEMRWGKEYEAVADNMAAELAELK